MLWHTSRNVVNETANHLILRELLHELANFFGIFFRSKDLDMTYDAEDLRPENTVRNQ